MPAGSRLPELPAGSLALTGHGFGVSTVPMM